MQQLKFTVYAYFSNERLGIPRSSKNTGYKCYNTYWRGRGPCFFKSNVLEPTKRVSKSTLNLVLFFNPFFAVTISI